MDIIWGLGGAFCLYVFYRMLQTEWPQNYSDMSSVVDSASQKNLWIYSGMRVLPIYVVAVLVAVSVHNTEGRIWLGLIALGVGHIFTTNLRLPILRGLSSSKGRSRWGHVAFHVLNTVMIAVAVAAAFPTWHFWKPITPDADELVQAIWTALFVGLMLTLLQRVGQYDRSPKALYARAKRDLGNGLSGVLDAKAAEHDVSIDFVRAIVLTECVQRPRWVRRLERLKGRFAGDGTYGVAQVSAASPISDNESIERLCTAHAGYYPVPNNDDQVNRTLLTVQFESHNPDPVFTTLAMEFFDMERPRPRDASDDLALDCRAHIEVVAIQRRQSYWTIEISVVPGESVLESRAHDREGVEEVGAITIPESLGIRQYVSVEFPIKISILELLLVAEGGETSSTLSLDLDDPWLS